MASVGPPQTPRLQLTAGEQRSRAATLSRWWHVQDRQSEASQICTATPLSPCLPAHLKVRCSGTTEGVAYVRVGTAHSRVARVQQQGLQALWQRDQDPRVERVGLEVPCEHAVHRPEVLVDLVVRRARQHSGGFCGSGEWRVGGCRRSSVCKCHTTLVGSVCQPCQGAKGDGPLRSRPFPGGAETRLGGNGQGRDPSGTATTPVSPPEHC